MARASAYNEEIGMASRRIKLWLTDEWKQKIQLSMLLNRLQDHASGKIEMSPTQVRAAEILLRKVAPDLSSTDATITHKTTFAEAMTRVGFADQHVTPEPIADQDRPAVH
jgi:hypothetical protein